MFFRCTKVFEWAREYTFTDLEGYNLIIAILNDGSTIAITFFIVDSDALAFVL
jgi:hypothetical protein